VSKEVNIDIASIVRSPSSTINVEQSWQPRNVLPYAEANIHRATFEGECHFEAEDIELSGKISVEFSALCDRCGSRTDSTITLDFDQTFYRHPEDADDYSYTGNTVDATKALEDEIALAAPTSLMCEECATNNNN
jgi:uncharacterized metal-binding protein YceD (DUF177 family)